MAQQTFTGKTGVGSASLGAARLCIDLEIRLTAITSPKVRKLRTFSTTQRVQFAGSYGLAYDGGLGKLVVRQYTLTHDKQDIAEPSTVLATDVWWDLANGVTATLVVTY